MLYSLLKFPIKLWVNCRIVAEKLITKSASSAEKPIFYVVRNQSVSDILSLQKACKKLNLPDPLSPVIYKKYTIDRTLCLENPIGISGKASPYSAQSIGLEVLNAHQEYSELEAQLIPVNILWGRKPSIEKNNANVGSLLADQDSPGWLRKFFIVLFLGRNTLVRFSQPLSFRYMADTLGTDDKVAKKLIRIARFHFHRQKIAATGPRLITLLLRV